MVLLMPAQICYNKIFPATNLGIIRVCKYPIVKLFFTSCRCSLLHLCKYCLHTHHDIHIPSTVINPSPIATLKSNALLCILLNVSQAIDMEHSVVRSSEAISIIPEPPSKTITPISPKFILILLLNPRSWPPTLCSTNLRNVKNSSLAFASCSFFFAIDEPVAHSSVINFVISAAAASSARHHHHQMLDLGVSSHLQFAFLFHQFLLVSLCHHPLQHCRWLF